MFGDGTADTPGAVRKRWEEIKREQEGREGVFHDVPEALPALLQARKVQRRAASVGFEYPDVEGALADLEDELAELKAELPAARRSAAPTSSATCSSRASTSRVGSTPTPSSSFAAPPAASSPASRGPSASPPPFLTWTELDLDQFARAFADAMAKDEPDRFTINSRKAARKGRIFLDYLRNDETASAIAPYSVGGRPGAPVSLPIDWKELAPLKSGAIFGMKEVLKRRADPWRSMSKIGRQSLPLFR